MVMSQRRSVYCLDATTYCVLFGAFGIYIIIVLVARQPYGEKP